MQADALGSRLPDILGLQEVTDVAWNRLKQKLSGTGLIYNAYSRDLIPSSRKLKAMAVFSRWPFTVLNTYLTVPYPELALSVMVATPSGDMQFHCGHIPNGSSHEWEKIEAFEGIYSKLARSSDFLRILCGDFNSPKEELDNGDIVPWRPGYPRWSNGELSVISGLSKFNLPDVYRQLHGYQPRDFSWYSRPHIGGRFDHIFASNELVPYECGYIHEWRTDKLSDHSAIEVVFSPLS